MARSTIADQFAVDRRAAALRIIQTLQDEQAATLGNDDAISFDIERS